jgi:uncharacterized coiled-coil protein SlyX
MIEELEKKIVLNEKKISDLEKKITNLQREKEVLEKKLLRQKLTLELQKNSKKS